MTACNDCKFHRQMMFIHLCVADETKEVFDFKTGKMVGESDLCVFKSFIANRVYCYDKNTGGCPDFQLIEKGASNGY